MEPEEIDDVSELEQLELRLRAEIEDLEMKMELLDPYLVTDQTTVEDAVAALRARLESGDEAEQERYEKLMLRGLKLKFGATCRSRRHRSAAALSS